MSKNRSAPGRLRIVAGNWRGRRLPVPDVPGLRPTAERVRETLFNWLMMWIPGKRCLDLYAGTGALGLEALSRGAASCVFVERQSAALRQLRQNIETLGAANAELRNGDAMQLLGLLDPSSIDLAFLDPPFGDGALGLVFSRLDESGILAPEARVYVEGDRNAEWPAFPDRWDVFREGRAGNVRYALMQRRTQ